VIEKRQHEFKSHTKVTIGLSQKSRGGEPLLTRDKNEASTKMCDPNAQYGQFSHALSISANFA